MKQSEQTAADETGWRIGGRSAWLHAWVGDRATAYPIDSQRSAPVPERVIGVDWSGILSHDGFASHDRFEAAAHQQCAAHVLRRARDLLADAARGAVRFPRQVLALFTEAIHWRNEVVAGRLAPTEDEREEQREAFDDRLRSRVDRRRAVPACTTFARRLAAHLGDWFGFVFDPRIEPTNWRAEQAVRPAVVNRKVWGGNRTEAGARAQGVLMSVIQTCTQRAIQPFAFLRDTLLRPTPSTIPA